MLALGLISGTSADAIDVALIETDGRPRLLATHAEPYTAELRDSILALGQSGTVSLQALGELDVAIARAFAHAALNLLDINQRSADTIAVLGSHGQTVWHSPDSELPFTLQLGDPNVIAELTGITTVADFRRRDIAAGGQGAPLVPAFHQALFQSAYEDRAILNLGGIANLTLLSAEGSIRGFDTGPANALLDAWCSRNWGLPCDTNGAFAASGRVVQGLLDELMADPYFARPAPKSTGREYFHLGWLEARLGSRPSLSATDLQATLLQLTARSIAEALKREAPNTLRVFACGGGVQNPVLMKAIAEAIAPMELATVEALGVNADFLEAMAFAWMASETLQGRASNLPEVTGARGRRVLGVIARGLV
ncbi:MAG: anhydro-N-acetylmuramic acid kinase [Ahniella sp.]|nr:anhydro-N-acetylmuramic acid kinase [Ahniella sp.]